MASCAYCGRSLAAATDSCPHCGRGVESTTAVVGEERKLATVLFADLVGSTAMADDEDPERTRLQLSRFYDAMTDEIARGGGTLDKFIGDGVMAVFGAPRAQEDHAERALHTALAMRERLSEVFAGAVELRIGVNTGELIVGHSRESSSFVTGDAVNVAARLEQAAEPGEILVGERTAAAVEGAFELGTPTTIAAKGKSAGIICRRLQRTLAKTRPRGIGGLHPVFVGRERELEAIRNVYSGMLNDGQPRSLVLIGEPGVGKTTLVQRSCDWLRAHPSAPVLRTGHCHSSSQGLAFLPIGEILREHLEPPGGESAATLRDRLGDRDILALTLGLEAPAGLHPLAVQDRLRHAWVAFVDELLANGPVIILIEDLHWADDALLNLLDASLLDARGPLLLLATAREMIHRQHSWGARRGVETVWLDPLPPDDATRLIDLLVPGGLPESFRALIIERAEGNPLFVEEILRTLIDRGVIDQGEEEWIVREEPPSLVVPDGVHALLASRIDLLDAPEKSALQAAAVIGRTFWSGPVYELLDGVAPDLRVLEDRNFVVHRPRSAMSGELEFEFSHALIREVAYGSLPKVIRARWHARFASWLERTGLERNEVAPLLAGHYGEAVRSDDVDLVWAGQEAELTRLRERAVTWLRTAAELAVGRYEITEGLALLHQAATLESDRAAQVEIWRSIAHANALFFDGRAFWEAMRRAIDLAEDGSTIGELYSEMAFQTLIRAGMWDSAPEADLVEDWVARALELSSPASEARAKALIARCYSQYEKSLDMIEEASAIAERLDDTVLRSYALDLRGLRDLAADENDVAAGWHRRRVGCVDEIADPDHRADIYAGAIIPAAALGCFDEARAYAAAHEEITATLSPHHRLHGVSATLELEELLGDWEAAVRLQEPVEAAVEANAATPCLRNQRSLLICALARTHLGDDAEAARLEEAAGARGVTGYGTVLDSPRMRLALQRHDLDAVESLIGEPAVRRTNWFYLSSLAAHLDGLAAIGDRARVEADARRFMLPGSYLEPFALRALGLVREDPDLVARAAGRFDALGMSWHAARTREGVV